MPGVDSAIHHAPLNIWHSPPPSLLPRPSRDHNPVTRPTPLVPSTPAHAPTRQVKPRRESPALSPKITLKSRTFPFFLLNSLEFLQTGSCIASFFLLLDGIIIILIILRPAIPPTTSPSPFPLVSSLPIHQPGLLSPNLTLHTSLISGPCDCGPASSNTDSYLSRHALSVVSSPLHSHPLRQRRHSSAQGFTILSVFCLSP